MLHQHKLMLVDIDRVVIIPVLYLLLGLVIDDNGILQIIEICGDEGEIQILRFELDHH